LSHVLFTLLTVNCKAAGEGYVKFQITCNGNHVTTDTSRDQVDYDVHNAFFYPECNGEYEIRAWFNDTEIRGEKSSRVHQTF